MLIPRFSLRILLLLMTASGAFFYIVMLAVRGQVWAVSVSIALSSLLLAFLLYAMTFALGWGLSSTFHLAARRNPVGSPFASAAPPPQVIVPPQDPD